MNIHSFKRPPSGQGSCSEALLRSAGNDDSGDDIGQDAAAAQGGKYHPDQPHDRGIHIKILGDASADAVQHLVIIGFIQFLISHGRPSFRSAPAKRCIRLSELYFT